MLFVSQKSIQGNQTATFLVRGPGFDPKFYYDKGMDILQNLWSYTSMPKTEAQVNTFIESFHYVVFNKDLHMNTALIKHKLPPTQKLQLVFDEPDRPSHIPVFEFCAILHAEKDR